MDGKPFDIIFLDVQMPKMDGFICASEIYKKFGPKLKIYLVTGNLITKNLRKEAEKIGILDILSKPINKNDLIQILK